MSDGNAIIKSAWELGHFSLNQPSIDWKISLQDASDLTVANTNKQINHEAGPLICENINKHQAVTLLVVIHNPNIF